MKDEYDALTFDVLDDLAQTQTTPPEIPVIPSITKTEKPRGRPMGSVKTDSLKKTVLVPIRMTAEDAEVLDAGARRSGAGSRSMFIRSAINDKLDKMGLY